MATFKTTLVDEKIDEISAAIKTMMARNTEDPTDPTYVSKSTRQTQLYHLKRERKVLHLVKSLLAANPDVVLAQDDQETFFTITTLASERVTTKYVFKEGDDLLDLMEKYPNLSRKDMEQKLEKLGLKIDFKAKKVVKA
jgi:hypothetical protein